MTYAKSKQIKQTRSRNMWHDRWDRGKTGRTYLLPAPINSKTDRHYQPTTQSTPDCHISTQNMPCTAECPPTSHQDRSPSKVCRLYDKIRSTTWIHCTTAENSHLQYVSHEQTGQDCPKSGGPRKVKELISNLLPQLRRVSSETIRTWCVGPTPRHKTLRIND